MQIQAVTPNRQDAPLKMAVLGEYSLECGSELGAAADRVTGESSTIVIHQVV